ncbi:WD40 repeat domain-containing protein [Nocardia sp. NPDC056952]|uniref:WD40 repeat domain-containing protein n=1 Tax=Nocardia sp. NPDC056952 TaxID=3345979 RepID=UPI00363FD4DF
MQFARRDTVQCISKYRKSHSHVANQLPRVLFATVDPMAGLKHAVGHTDAVPGIAFSPDGTAIATGGTDRTARIWDATTGAQAAELVGAGSVATNAAGTVIVTGSSRPGSGFPLPNAVRETRFRAALPTSAACRSKS